MKTEMEALIYHFKIFTEGFSPLSRLRQRWNPRASWAASLPATVPQAAACALPLAVLHQSAGASEIDQGQLMHVMLIGHDIVLGEVDR